MNGISTLTKKTLFYMKKYIIDTVYKMTQVYTDVHIYENVSVKAFIKLQCLDFQELFLCIFLLCKDM